MFKSCFFLVCAALLGACGGGGGGADGAAGTPMDQRFALQPAYPNLSFDSPLAVSTAPGDGTHLYVAQQGGLIRSFAATDAATAVAPQTFLDLRDRTRASGEQGLLGFAFDADYASNGHVYVYYNANANPDTGTGDSVIARYTADPISRAADPCSEVQLLRFAQPFNNHNGGALAVGPDGHLYIASGDGGSGNDPQNNAQNLGNLLGKILRIDGDGGIPADNPFVNTPGARGEIWAYGLRNPFRMSFDAANGRLWAGDVGQGAQEEIDLIQRGGNHGWRLYEGTRSNVNPDNVPFTEFVAPVFTYPRSQGRSITGGVVYRGSALPALNGRYVYGDFVSGRIWVLTEAGGAATQNVEIGSLPNPSSFGFDLNGEVIITAYDGQLYRLVADDQDDVGALPARLSQAGLFTDLQNLTTAEGMIEYAPAAAFWSDGSDKQRWLKLPPGGRIAFSAEGAWTFPVGTQTVKHFEIDAVTGRRRLETRVFVLQESGWLGYTYRWNPSGTDADLLPGGASETLEVADGDGTRNQTYHYPDRTQCLQCHTAAAGFVLGIRTAQLNVPYTYADGSTQNQLQFLADAAVFEGDIGNPQTYAALADPLDPTQPLAARARAYLDTNCAHCHLPAGPTSVDMDLRAATALAATQTDGVTASGARVGGAALRLDPGNRENSLLWTRMNTLIDNQRMPPLSTQVIDQDGVALIGTWIDGGAD